MARGESGASALMRLKKADLVEEVLRLRRASTGEPVPNEAPSSARVDRNSTARPAAVKSDLASAINKRVRPSIDGMLGMARLLADTDLNPEQRRCVEAIVNEGDGVATFVDGLLEVCHLEANRLKLERVPFAPREAIEQAVADFVPHAESKGLTLRSRISNTVPSVALGDGRRLRQILRYLIANALESTEKGAIEVAASGSSGREKDENGSSAVLGISVTDTGRGISPEAHSALFSTGTKGAVDFSRVRGVSGLGLSICRRLAVLMGGEVTGRSTLGEGSRYGITVRLDLDAAMDPADMLRPADRFAGADNELTTAKRLRVLLVEGDTTNRRVAEKILRRAGHKVATANEGALALRRLQAERFDILIIDRRVPGMDGLETTRRIRREGGAAAWVPVLGVTATGRQADLDECMEAGMDAAVARPYRAESLLPIISGVAQLREFPNLSFAGRVLVVDDMRVHRGIAATYLGRLGIDCDLARDGNEALTLVQERDYALVLADMAMPDMDGPTLAGRIRKIVPTLPIVAVTGQFSPEDRQDLLVAGLDDTMRKPVELLALIEILSTWNGRRSTLGVGRPAAVGDVPPAAGLVDFEGLSSILGTERSDQLYRMLDIFVDLFPELLRELRGAASRRGRVILSDEAHAARGAADDAAARELSALLRDLEEQAPQASWDDLDRTTERVSVCFDRLAAAIANRTALG